MDTLKVEIEAVKEKKEVFGTMPVTTILIFEPDSAKKMF